MRQENSRLQSQRRRPCSAHRSRSSFGGREDAEAFTRRRIIGSALRQEHLLDPVRQERHFKGSRAQPRSIQIRHIDR